MTDPRVTHLGKLARLATLALGVQACAASSEPDPTAAAVRQYALLLRANYGDVIEKLGTLKTSVDRFVAAPSQEGFDAAKQAWLASRGPYGQAEVSRFYAGPLD